MTSLIAVIILIIFICFCYFFIKKKYDDFKIKYFGTTDIKSIIEDAKMEDQELPKSLSSMDSIYLEQIQRDFPGLNINELKSYAEKILLDSFKAIESGTSNSIKQGKVKSFVDKKISELGSKKVKYKNFKIHKTVVSQYSNHKGIASIYFGISFEYIFSNGTDSIKTQDRAKVEYIYIIDSDRVDSSLKGFGVNCPNCGAPIKSLGNKYCSYCNTGIVDLVKKSWICNDLKLY